ncbi:MAG: T9SS type A sorting domain-containing protein [Bacteroidales bacterium]
MKKKLLITVLALALIHFTFGQGIENPGFEEWEDAGTVIDEPVNWSSIKTSDAGPTVNNAAPVVWGQSTESHTGNYSLRLENILVLGVITATGTITNGRVHADFNPTLGTTYTNPDDDRWHTPFTGRPDSISAWFKYTPVGNDTSQIKVLLHTGDGQWPLLPANESGKIATAQINVTGTIDTWTRFSAPFTYFSEETPEYILFNLTAGAGLEAVVGSVVLLDDLELIGETNSINHFQANETFIYYQNDAIHFRNTHDNQVQFNKLEIINLDGRIFLSAILEDGQNNIKVNAPDGLYMIKLSGEEGVYTQKIFIK